ncbi:MAG TPA: S9 family peptidase [Ignavibacteria bacterium]
MRKKTLIIFLLLIVIILSKSQDKHNINVDDLIKMKRLGSLKIDKENNRLFFNITEYNYLSNKGKSRILFLNLIDNSITNLISDEYSCYDPVPSPNGRYLAYIKSFEGVPQIFIYDFQTKESKQITNVVNGVSGLLWSPDNKKIAFVSDVYPDCTTMDCNKSKVDSINRQKIKAKILTRLPYRVWNYWKDDKRSHLFIVNVEDNNLLDITSGDYDIPPIDVNGNFDYAFSPDGKEICYVKNIDSAIALSTNNDLFIYNFESSVTKKITINKACDNQPLYSPDGRYIAYRAMKIPGFEADKYNLILYDRTTGDIKSLTEKIDLSINEFIWANDSKSIYFTSQKHLYSNLYKIDLSGKYETVVEGKYITNIILDNSGDNIYCFNQDINNPSEINKINLKSKNIFKLTNFNDSILVNINMNSLEEFIFAGANGTKVQGFMVKPASFDKNKKYPLVLLIHGGPQGAWTSSWSYRWNPQMYASNGYVVACINPRGSTGYGQKFCDDISGDWGGKAYIDLMKGVDYLINNYSFIDKEKIAAAGASYGGYMVNWILGHTNRFKCLISHAGVFNLESMYGTTEELWFPEYEFKGTPWNNPNMYSKFSPHKYVKNFKTPTLVIHGELDFRVPISEGIQLFTALQRKGIPSKFLYFPDEGHWVQKPQNLKLWFDTIFEWLNSYLQ